MSLISRCVDSLLNAPLFQKARRLVVTMPGACINRERRRGADTVLKPGKSDKPWRDVAQRMPMRVAAPGIPRCLAAALLSVPASAATTYEIFPTGETTSCSEQFETLANTLEPGDELVLHDGEYWQSCRRAITINGTAAEPIVIRAADGARPVITRAADDFNDNNIEIDGSYFTIRGLVFRGGSVGVRFLGGHHITFEDNEVFNTANNAINMNSGDTDSFVIRNNHIHDTGIVGSDTEGEGMYVGCHSGSCVASNHLIEGNHIHHLRSTSSGGNDGIELKYRSFGNIVRGNLIHDTNIGTEYPCIFSYGGGNGPRNVIENNVVYNCGEAILVTADTIVRNNVILDSSSHGIHSRTQSPSSSVRNVTIVGNTVHGSHPRCAQLRWSSASDVIFANNALFCAGSTAVDFSGLSNATVKNNYVVGGMSGANIDNDRFFDGGSATANFVDPANGDFHLRAGSMLIDAGDATVADLGDTDNDGNARILGAGIDVGAFEHGSDPVTVTVTLDANPRTVQTGGSSTLTWSSSGATGCSASGAWSGTRPTSGTETVGPLAEASTFSLSCTNSSSTASDAVTVNVTAPSGDSDDDGLPDDWEQAYFGTLDQQADDDPDADHLDNAGELVADTDPTNPDSDADGLLDGREAGFGTDPNDSDSDDDGFDDGTELDAGSDPNDAGSVPQADPTPADPAPDSNSASGAGSVGYAMLVAMAGLLLVRRRRAGSRRYCRSDTCDAAGESFRVNRPKGFL